MRIDLEFLNEQHYTINNEQLRIEEGIPIPQVGDSVIIGGGIYKVLERTFVYQGIKQKLSRVIFICKNQGKG